jgi:hypothetical protein
MWKVKAASAEGMDHFISGGGMGVENYLDFII